MQMPYITLCHFWGSVISCYILPSSVMLHCPLDRAYCTSDERCIHVQTHTVYVECANNFRCANDSTTMNSNGDV